jgi:hypothetical protein
MRHGTISGERRRCWVCVTINFALCIAGSIRRRIPGKKEDTCGNSRFDSFDSLITTRSAVCVTSGRCRAFQDPILSSPKQQARGQQSKSTLSRNKSLRKYLVRM